MSFLVFLLLASKADVMDSVVPDTQAAAHVGQVVTLDCNVVNVKHAHTGMVFVGCGGLYPNILASLVVFAENVAALGDLDQYKGKHLFVHGKLEVYKGKPEIVLTHASQIEEVQ